VISTSAGGSSADAGRDLPVVPPGSQVAGRKSSISPRRRRDAFLSPSRLDALCLLVRPNRCSISTRNSKRSGVSTSLEGRCPCCPVGSSLFLNSIMSSSHPGAARVREAGRPSSNAAAPASSSSAPTAFVAGRPRAAACVASRSSCASRRPSPAVPFSGTRPPAALYPPAPLSHAEHLTEPPPSDSGCGDDGGARVAPRVVTRPLPPEARVGVRTPARARSVRKPPARSNPRLRIAQFAVWATGSRALERRAPLAPPPDGAPPRVLAVGRIATSLPAPATLPVWGCRRRIEVIGCRSVPMRGSCRVEKTRPSRARVRAPVAP